MSWPTFFGSVRPVHDVVRWWLLGSSLMLIGLGIGSMWAFLRSLERRWAPTPDDRDAFEDIIATIRWDDE